MKQSSEEARARILSAITEQARIEGVKVSDAQWRLLNDSEESPLSRDEVDALLDDDEEDRVIDLLDRYDKRLDKDGRSQFHEWIKLGQTRSEYLAGLLACLDFEDRSSPRPHWLDQIYLLVTAVVVVVVGMGTLFFADHWGSTHTAPKWLRGNFTYNFLSESTPGMWIGRIIITAVIAYGIQYFVLALWKLRKRKREMNAQQPML